MLGWVVFGTGLAAGIFADLLIGQGGAGRASAAALLVLAIFAFQTPFIMLYEWMVLRSFQRWGWNALAGFLVVVLCVFTLRSMLKPPLRDLTKTLPLLVCVWVLERTKLSDETLLARTRKRVLGES